MRKRLSRLSRFYASRDLGSDRTRRAWRRAKLLAPVSLLMGTKAFLLGPILAIDRFSKVLRAFEGIESIIEDCHQSVTEIQFDRKFHWLRHGHSNRMSPRFAPNKCAMTGRNNLNSLDFGMVLRGLDNAVK